MLQKFLLIGIGGSGGKTLRLLRADLRRALDRVGYRQPLPAAWQFLHIDVPREPDGNEPSLPPQLPHGDYLGLAPQGLSYRHLDEMLVAQGDSVRRHLVGWRPDPDGVAVAPAHGAGQYRAVGRVIAGASMREILRSVHTALGRLDEVGVQSELDAVATALGVADTTATLDPAVVVVASLAGGSGAGAVLDVCDAVRLVGPKWADESIAVLYTPDVFDELAPASRAGVQPNALALLSELLAGYWNTDQRVADEFAFVEAAGVAASQVGRRGPRYPLVVGRSNGRVAFGGQNEVYRAVARLLATWVTSARVQDSVRSNVLGNWSARATHHADGLGLAGEGAEAPLASVGFASVGLGRDRFAEYASQRLARAAVERALRGHWNAKVIAGDLTPAQAADQTAEDLLHLFLAACGLREAGAEDTQVLDAIRGGPTSSARVGALASLRATVTSEVFAGRKDLPPPQLAQAVEARLLDHWHEVFTAERAADEERARAWVRDVQAAVVAQSAVAVGRYGATVTVRLLDKAAGELRGVTVPTLRASEDRLRREVSTMAARIRGTATSFDGLVRPENPVVERTVKEGTNSLWWELEAELHRLAASLVADLAANVLEPLRDAVEAARAGLEDDETDPPSGMSVVHTWPERHVPERLRPAQNEILLEPPEWYPAAFESLVSATVGTREPGTALGQAVREVLEGTSQASPSGGGGAGGAGAAAGVVGGASAGPASGSGSSGGQTLIRTATRWAPREPALRTGEAEATAVFEVHLGAADVLDRARLWCSRPDTAMGGFLAQTLTEYLDAASAPPAEHRARLERFRAGFGQALATSAPFVAVDPATLQRVHAVARVAHERVMTTVPFPAGHAARAVARDLLVHEGMSAERAEAAFGDARTDRIDLTTFLPPLHAVVYESLVGPVADGLAARRHEEGYGEFWRWRRARPLPLFCPLPPRRLSALVRGWFLARLLGLVDVSAYQTGPVRLRAASGWLAFPSPLFGPRVARLDALLPALVETLPAALVAVSVQGPAAVAAYRELIELGSPHGAARIEDAEPPAALRVWLATGSLPPELADAPGPASVLVETGEGAGAGDGGAAGAGELATPAGRRNAAQRFLQRYRDHYERLHRVPTDPAAMLLAPRAWELRHEILGAIGGLQMLVAAAGEGDAIG